MAILLAFERRARLGDTEPPLSPEAEDTWPGVEIIAAGERLVVPAKGVRELMRFPPLTRIPGVQPWLKGVANVQGRLLTVVDLAGYLSGTMSIVGPAARVVALTEEEMAVGLLVDEVLGVWRYGDDDCGEDISAVADWVAPYARGTCRGPAGAGAVLDVRALVVDPRFVHAAL